jgi:hypothetical protein
MNESDQATRKRTLVQDSVTCYVKPLLCLKCIAGIGQQGLIIISGNVCMLMSLVILMEDVNISELRATAAIERSFPAC